MHRKCFEKYRRVPKIALPEAQAYRCAAWYCCVQLNTTMYPKPPGKKVGPPQPFPLGSLHNRLMNPVSALPLVGVRVTFINPRYRLC